MNNLISFWLAPITAFFHPQVYRDAAAKSAWRGVLYTLYLSFIAGILFLVLMLAMVLPVADEFVNWTQKNMPVVIWTPEGLSLENGKTTDLLVHPQYGPVIAFDMNKTSVGPMDMEKIYFLVTATKIYVKRSPTEIEARDITKAGIQTDKQLPPKIRVTGDVIAALFRVVKNTIFFIVPLSISIISFFLILLASLFYSLIGLLLNLMRKQKLRYGSIFSITCLASSASFTITWLQIMTPLRKLPLPFGWMILVTLVYMFFAFKISDNDSAKA